MLLMASIISGDSSFQFTPLREGRLAVRFFRLCYSCISIHAPARGATFQSTQPSPPTTYFNSRPCERGDGACRGLRRRISHDFNSRPCERGDLFLFFCRRGGYRFQFTPLREGRRWVQIRRNSDYFYFNSRPCERGDAGAPELVYINAISIHAPARGATAKSNKICSVFSAIIEKNSQLLDNTSFLKHPVF